MGQVHYNAPSAGRGGEGRGRRVCVYPSWRTNEREFFEAPNERTANRPLSPPPPPSALRASPTPLSLPQPSAGPPRTRGLRRRMHPWGARVASGFCNGTLSSCDYISGDGYRFLPIVPVLARAKMARVCTIKPAALPGRGAAVREGGGHEGFL